MRIAICDDDDSELLSITSILDIYQQERKAPIIYKAFNNATDLLASAKGGDFSVYLLDVVMPGMDGIEAAHEIRSFDSVATLIFLSSSTDFAYQSYSVKAEDYLVKPPQQEKLFAILDSLLIQQQNPTEGISIKTKSGITRILFSSLAYVEVMNKIVFFHLIDGSIREATASLVEFEEILLARKEFIRIHRSYIVNLWQISDFSNGVITTLAGQHLPVSRRLYPKARECYIEQIFGEK